MRVFAIESPKDHRDYFSCWLCAVSGNISHLDILIWNPEYTPKSLSKVKISPSCFESFAINKITLSVSGWSHCSTLFYER